MTPLRLRSQALLLIAAGLIPHRAAAQVVRGTVSERASSAPLVGVLITLQGTSGGADTVAVLSSARGEFAIRASGAGKYQLVAKRIGVRRYVSAPFDLAAGEVRRLDVVLDPVAQALPGILVAEYDLCLTSASQRPQVNAYWEEARAALTAARVSLRDRLFEGQIRRYSRGLDPRTLRVLEESWADVQGVIDRPFAGLSGDSLSRVGYRREVDSVTYFSAPDAEVLVSAAFLRDHCFGTVTGGRSRRGLVGLTFVPVPARTLPDVRGTVWLDARTAELRLVEFFFTGVEPFAGSGHVGGELHFARLANGAWMTSRWFLRTPQHARSTAPVDAESRRPSVIVRPTVHRLLEEGGFVESARPARPR